VSIVKRAHAIIISTVFLLFVLVPLVLPTGMVSAQGSGYSITGVSHDIEVMYTGQVLIRDTVHVSGQINDGFMIGLLSQFSGNILKVVAYDDNYTYQVNTGVPMGSHSDLYGVQINFGGKTPSVFTVAFILSINQFSYDPSSGKYILSFPAYPSLAQNGVNCNVTINFPSQPASLTITKSDGDVSANNYATKNLAAYSAITASASFQIAAGTLQLANVNQLDRTINIDANGKVTSLDKYIIVNKASTTMSTFILDVPPTATNVAIKDQFGTILSSEFAGTISYGSSDSTHNAELINATLINYLGSGQSTTLIAEYNLPSANLEGSQYNLNNFFLYPDFYYYVDIATFTFNPPEGATIIAPKISALDSSATVTRTTFQETLTTTRNGISYLDYSLPQNNPIQFGYTYNPVWVSFRPTFWLSFLAVMVCIAVVIIRMRNPEKVSTKPKAEKITAAKPASPATTPQVKAVAPETEQHLTPENIRSFTDAYEEKKQLKAELKAMDVRAQKGKIPRGQYKANRKRVELRIEALSRTIEKFKVLFRASGAAYADIAKQIDSAEEDLSEAEENIQSLESKQKNGEISLETYKEEVTDYQKQKEKAESTINGILLRLREKTR
jgi:hypothetical protein